MTCDSNNASVYSISVSYLRKLSIKNKTLIFKKKLSSFLLACGQGERVEMTSGGRNDSTGRKGDEEWIEKKQKGGVQVFFFNPNSFCRSTHACSTIITSSIVLFCSCFSFCICIRSTILFLPFLLSQKSENIFC